MSVSSLSLSCVLGTIKEKATEASRSNINEYPPQSTTVSWPNESQCSRRSAIMGSGSLVAAFLPVRPLLALDKPEKYEAFVDIKDGYSYYYPSDWIEFDFRGHDSAFKDRHLQLQNVRVRFIPTDKKDIHEMGPMDEVVSNLVNNNYAAPNQLATIYDMQEKNVDGKNYYMFEYELRSRNFASTSFATIAVANGRFYTLVVAANERRWRRFRDQLKVVADSFKVLDI
ncbi:hypothetical protein MLD38_002616 [Melastoma candidum]|uniref:Uncharacterized protein n=1 Tax=Melastoma candidum TaxID=119954 RepID=A0ACB9S1V4_9MYRT|nr:hypothetical protein MLD38_002616 [Melastoma candidum]